MNKSIHVSILLFLWSFLIYGQSYKAQLQEQYNNSELVIEATIVSSEGFRCEEYDELGRQTQIYTRHTIEINEVFKNTTEVSDLTTITLITYGGTIDGQTEVATHMAGRMKDGSRFVGFFNEPDQQIRCFSETELVVSNWKQTYRIYDDHGAQVIYPPEHLSVPFKDFLNTLTLVMSNK